MNLSELVASVVPNQKYGSLKELPDLERIGAIYEDWDRAEAFIANSVWQILFWDRYTRLCWPNLQGADFLVVPNGEGSQTRYDLLARGGFGGSLVPQAFPVSPVRLDPFIISTWQRDRAYQIEDRWLDQGQRSSTWGQTLRAIEEFSEKTFLSAVETGCFAIVTGPAQQYRLAATEIAAPAVDVRSVSNNGLLGTVGVFANRNGSYGATIAAHVLHDGVNWPAQGMKCSVGGVRGSIVSCDPISDSCFVEFEEMPPQCNLISSVGPLSGLSPRKFDPVTAYGAVSGTMKGTVQGWDPWLPVVTRFSQIRLSTTLMTAPGDSGAALIDSQDQVLGFSFMTSGYGSSVQESVWIWADSVFRVHGLR